MASTSIAQLCGPGTVCTDGPRARIQRDGVYGVPLDALEAAFRRIRGSPLIWFPVQDCEGRSRELDVRISRSSSLSPFQASEPKAPDPPQKCSFRQNCRPTSPIRASIVAGLKRAKSANDRYIPLQPYNCKVTVDTIDTLQPYNCKVVR